MKQKNGFTLIELIVVVAVILVISVLTILNYNSYTDKQRVKQSGMTLRSDLRLARTKATSGQKTALCDDTTVLESYNVEFSAVCGGKGPCYKIKPVCSNGGVLVDTTNEITRVFLPSSVIFAGTNAYQTIRFFTVTGITNLASDRIIVLSGSGVTYSIRVTTSGVISDY
ncbi:MAG: prepilin-type N-terminal cleavage/methylation domain-containing protein [Candidatus Gottesmanbacteria bacterium]